MIDPQKLQVLLGVLQRAPLTLAEQLIIQEVVDQLLEMTKPPDTTAAVSRINTYATGLNGVHEATLEEPAADRPNR